jgi:hypothetical protein
LVFPSSSCILFQTNHYLLQWLTLGALKKDAKVSANSRSKV